MKHIRFVITFFQILLFAVITGTNAQAANNCKTTQTYEYTTELAGWTCLANGDPSYTEQIATLTSCETCNSGYTRTQSRTVVSYTCYPNACDDISNINTSNCESTTHTLYTCEKSETGDDSGGTTTGPCANYTVANWDSTWTDVSSAGNEISISYDSSSGCNFSITDSNLIKDATGTFRAKNSLTDRIFCYEK